MEYKVQGNVAIVRMQKGEEVISSLLALIDKLDIKSGRVSGIGATDNVTIGVFNANTKEYTKNCVREDMEILSLSGNLSRMNGKPYAHIHGSFASLDRVYGGHVNEIYISATAELIIDIFDIIVEREFDKETGLNLIKL
ncbi:MAG: DNA-binding protein [Clostridia bacterium]|nr:DNA-binding protein [Clostridia bacterium]